MPLSITPTPKEDTITIKSKLDTIFAPSDNIQNLIKMFNGGFFRRRKAFSKYKVLVEQTKDIYKYIRSMAQNQYYLTNNYEKSYIVLIQIPTIEKNKKEFYLSDLHHEVFVIDPRNYENLLSKIIKMSQSLKDDVKPKIDVIKKSKAYDYFEWYIPSLSTGNNNNLINLSLNEILEKLYANETILNELATNYRTHDTPLFAEFQEEYGISLELGNLILDIIAGKHINYLELERE